MSQTIPKQLFTIQPNGEVQVKDIAVHPTAEEIHDIVGGYFELVPFLTNYHGRPCVAMCNTDGKRLNLPFNPYATAYWDSVIGGTGGDYLVGNIVIVVGPREWLMEM